VARLSIRAILAGSARIWRKDLWSLTLLAAALELPLVVADVALALVPGLRTATEERLTLGGLSFVVVLYGSLSHHFLAGVLERIVASERRAHRRPHLGEVLADLPWARMLVADVALTAMLLVGLMAFVVPGLLVLTWFSIALPIINLERTGVAAGFIRSYRLVRGHSWRVFAVALGAFAIPEVAIGVIASLVHHLADSPVLTVIGHAVPAIVLMPIAALPIVVMAFDLVALEAVDPVRPLA